MSLLTDVLSKVSLFTDLKDFPTITCVSKEWKSTVNDAEQMIWRSLMEKHFPRLAKIIAMGPDDNEYSWKEGFKTRFASPYKPDGLNKELQKDLETVFSPRGIVAFTNCCHVACSGAYNETGEFQLRQSDGIYFLCFTLNGMNYEPDKYTIWVGSGSSFGIPVSYGSLEYLNEHWGQECKLLDQFCTVIGLKEGEYNLHKPESITRCIVIENLKPIPLEAYPFEDWDDSEPEDYEMDDDVEDEMEV